MKCIVQIPCFNEEKTLPLVLSSIPKKIPGITTLELLVIDDGSTDRTSEIAKKMGVQHIIRHKQNKGLAASFADGVSLALNLGADIIVNTDADNQYPQRDIPKLIKPIVDGKADIVIANRQTWKISHFSQIKKIFQWFGSWVLRTLTQSKVSDAVSGFRAYSREAALQLNIVTDFSYVIETIISAQSKRMAIVSVNVETNPPTRPSRLFRNMFEHMRHSGATIIRIYTMFRPLYVFLNVGFLVFCAGLLLALRFLYYFMNGSGDGHIQSLILAAIFLLVGFQIAMTGMVADLIAINRRLLEQALRRVKLLELRQLRQFKPDKK
jgi:glycosyltransferase involved in cell wall biosynthesis